MVMIMTDIVEQVAQILTGLAGGVCCHKTGGKDMGVAYCECRQTAKLIDGFYAEEIEWLRDALRSIACGCSNVCDESPNQIKPSVGGCFRYRARLALMEEKE